MTMKESYESSGKILGAGTYWLSETPCCKLESIEKDVISL